MLMFCVFMSMCHIHNLKMFSHLTLLRHSPFCTSYIRQAAGLVAQLRFSPLITSLLFGHLLITRIVNCTVAHTNIVGLGQLENPSPLDSEVEGSILTPYKKAGGPLEAASLPLGRGKVVYMRDWVDVDFLQKPIQS